jgi:hypothetical protein
MGEAVQLLLDHSRVAQYYPKPGSNLVRKETDPAVFGYMLAAGLRPPGDNLQALSTEAGRARRHGYITPGLLRGRYLPLTKAQSEDLLETPQDFHPRRLHHG